MLGEIVVYGGAHEGVVFPLAQSLGESGGGDAVASASLLVDECTYLAAQGGGLALVGGPHAEGDGYYFVVHVFS